MPLEIYEKHGGDVDYWSEYWSTERIDEQQQFIESNFLTNIFYKYLSKTDPILEGGCGLGKWVFYLNKKGYKITGIEWSKETVNTAKLHEPNIPIKVGDIFNFEYSDQSFQSYISLGVIEHHKNYQMALDEAYRVISDNGYMLCSVPYFNPVRQFKNLFGVYKPKAGDKFFEYRFKINEICNSMRNSGFEIIEIIPFSVPYGLTLEFPLIKHIRNIVGKKQKKMWYSVDSSPESIKSSNALLKIMKYIIESHAMSYMFGHMIMIVGRKNAGNKKE